MNTRWNLTVLFVCQALYWGAVITGITLSAVVGASLAPEKLLATLPAGLLAVGAITVTAPVSLFMQRFGRRAGFRLGTVSGALGGGICALSIIEPSFVGFCFGNFLLGVYQACANYYRLAATDSVPAGQRGRAISWVMAGGLVAAVFGPTASVWSKELVDTALYAGSYLMIVALGVVATALLGLLRTSATSASGSSTATASSSVRPMGEVIRQPVFVAAVANAGVSHGTMILVMTATPLAMVGSNYQIEDAALVIQCHVFGMFLPAFFSGKLVDRFGPAAISVAGAGVFAVSIALAATDTVFTHFLVSSLLLGAGWNLMYVAGTTLIARSHTDSERGRVQGAAELGIALVAALSAIASGGLLAYLGWAAVNLGAIPLLICAVGISIWFSLSSEAAKSS
ncbi:MAG: MFS transporter [Chromatiales bacterium]|jgi:MFS family permease|nr:MFS transporter [Chromatiales bacterium]